jgi:GxxExxY protein
MEDVETSLLRGERWHFFPRRRLGAVEKTATRWQFPQRLHGTRLSLQAAMTELDEITGTIVDASLRIHRELGPGLLESVYEAVLARALDRRGLCVERHPAVTFEYDGMSFHEGLRVDLLVERRVVVELKSVETLAPVHHKQVLTYLKLLQLPVGLLINFGAPTLKQGLHRIVNNLSAADSPSLKVNQRL